MQLYTSYIMHGSDQKQMYRQPNCQKIIRQNDHKIVCCQKFCSSKKKDKKQAALLLGSCYLSFISADSTQIWWFTGMLMPHPTWLHWPEKDSGYLSPNFSFQAAWMDEWLICRLKQLGENDYDWDTNSFSGQYGNAGCDQQCLLLFIHL